ncbi:hypothetical protein BDR22DRAFT_864113 [Usnea florida]
MNSPRGSANDVEGVVGTEVDIDEGQEQETSDFGEDNNGTELDDGSPQDSIEFRADEDVMDDGNDNEGSEEFPSYKFPWLKTTNIHIKASDAADSPNIGRCTAKLIDRDQIRAYFHRGMAEVSNNAANLAFDIFDRWGCLKSAYQCHPIKKGTGVWGPELNSGRFLLIEIMAVAEQYQRKGYGKELFRQVWERAQEMSAQIDDERRTDHIRYLEYVWETYRRDRQPPIAVDDWIDRGHPGLRSGQQKASPCDFAIVRATVLKTDKIRAQTNGLSSAERQKFYREKLTALEHYWRAMGFRRIGSSPYFCLAKDAKHPAHLLTPQDDYMRPAALWFSPRGNVQDFPILNSVPKQGNFEHTALTDIEAKELLEARIQSHPTTHPSWLSVDRHGNNILHILAREYKSEALTWTLSLPFAASLRSVRNLEGETPLETLETQIESDRSFKVVALAGVVMADIYSGLASNQLQCLRQLKCIENPSHDELQRLCFGCTCGLCLGGFLSPRVAYSLQCESESQYHWLNEIVDDTEDLFDDWYRSSKYLAPRVKDNLKTDKSMRQGFANLFSFISPTLQAKRLPTSQNILDLQGDSNEWPPATRNYLQRGGTVHAVVQSCFEDAIARGRSHEEMHQKEIAALPVCRNDREFVFARRQCRRLEGLPDNMDPRVGVGGIW